MCIRDSFGAGELLGVTKDYEGNVLERAVAQESGVVLYLSLIHIWW